MKFTDIWSSVEKITSEAIPLDQIEKNLTPVDKKFVAQLEQAASEQNYLSNLEQSIDQTGMKTPIQIKRTDRGWHIPEGNHRLIVARRLQLKSVPVRFV